MYNQSLALRRLLLRLNLTPVGTRHDGPAPSLSAPLLPDIAASGGLRKKDLEDPFVPVIVQVQAYSDMNLNDQVDLYWNDNLVGYQLVNPGHLDSRILTFQVFPGDITGGVDVDATAQVHYHATSALGGTVRVSHATAVRVRTLVPGNPAQDADDSSTEFVNENLPISEGVPEYIDGNALEGPLTVSVPPYAHMAVQDRLTLYWAGQPIRYTVQQGDLERPIELEVSRELILENAGPNLIVRYDIRDEVSNWSLYSLDARVDVDGGANTLPAPRVENEGDGIIDLDELGDADLRIEIPVYPERKTGDVITLT